MPYYFMRDTPLQAMEQLMMSQPGQKPRGGGIRMCKAVCRTVKCTVFDNLTPASMRSQSGWSAVSAGPCIAAAHGHETVKNESCGAV